MGMIFKRCLSSLPLLFLLSVLAFSIIKCIPGDPVDVLLGNAQRDISPAQLASMRSELGLDQPLWKQYSSWLGAVVTRGEFGRSYQDGRPALSVIVERLPATLILVGTALFVSFTLGTFWGMAMAFLKEGKLGSALDSLLVSCGLILYCAPGFWVGFLAIALAFRFGAVLHLPLLSVHPPGRSIEPMFVGAYVLLPALVLASRRTAKIALFVRAATLEEMSKEYAVFARSKGLSRMAVLTRHALKNSLLPLISLMGLSLPALLGGSVLVETVFAWPGMGRLAVEATFGRNYPVILALVLIYGTLVILANLIADLLQMAVDPRQLSLETNTNGRV
ncbi:MAG TPA: ABC transporter permease [Chroococcales cyanobacterium]